MVKLTVKIVSMQDADKFNKLCSKFNCDMDLQSGKYYVDAKSIMGIFSLDLSKPLILNADTDDEELIKEMMFYDSLLNELHYLNNIANPKDKEFRIKRAYPHIDNNIKDLVGGCFFASKYCKTFRSFESQYFFV